jgi:hypothetical protein
LDALTQSTDAIRIGAPGAQTAPFPHFLVDDCLDKELAAELLDWFERQAPWRLVETDFYEQYEFSLFDADLPQRLKTLVDPSSLAALRDTMSKAFGTAFKDRMTVVAHKLVRGHRIAIHNDFLDGEETHRLTVQVNRGLKDSDGGFFMLFNSCDAADVHKVLRPISGTGLGFEIGPHSYHAVSAVHGGERYTLVFSFYARPRPASA